MGGTWVDGSDGSDGSDRRKVWDESDGSGGGRKAWVESDGGIESNLLELGSNGFTDGELGHEDGIVGHLEEPLVACLHETDEGSMDEGEENVGRTILHHRLLLEQDEGVCRELRELALDGETVLVQVWSMMVHF